MGLGIYNDCIFRQGVVWQHTRFDCRCISDNKGGAADFALKITIGFIITKMCGNAAHYYLLKECGLIVKLYIFRVGFIDWKCSS